MKLILIYDIFIIKYPLNHKKNEFLKLKNNLLITLKINLLFISKKNLIIIIESCD